MYSNGMLTIKNVISGSPAYRAGLRPGDRITAVNGATVSDDFEFNFFVSGDDPNFTILRGDTESPVPVARNSEDELGLELQEVLYHSCGNHCQFCFVDQLPKGLRKSLYFKDEDYRLSFLYGNYITCTWMTDARIDRIIEMGLSPLYISVHATDARVRKRLLGVRKSRPIMEILERLAKGGITMHTQVVVCPGFNDGPILEKTLDDLAQLHPQVASVAVIPVGLTRHRGGLSRLKPVTKSGAWKMQDMISRRQRRWQKQLGTRFVFAADELYLRAQVAVPVKAAYEDLAQLENGIGMVRQLLDNIRLGKTKLFKKRTERRTVIIVTGKSMAPILQEQFSGFRGGLRIRVVGMVNHLLGAPITVSGLLAGADIEAGLVKRNIRGDVVLLPPNCLNDNGVFIDDMTPAQLEKALRMPVVQGDYDITASLLKVLKMPLSPARAVRRGRY